jgi:hypothetical protein
VNIVAYVNLNLLNLLSTSVLGNDELLKDLGAAQAIWEHFKEDRIRLVTDWKETEMDIILWLNRQGCCVTDTLVAIEAVKDFEKWGKTDAKVIRQYKQILGYYDDIEILPNRTENYTSGKGTKGTQESDKKLLSLLCEEILSFSSKDRDSTYHQEENCNVLQECLNDLDHWYTHTDWRDMRRIDYTINWNILESVLSKRQIEPVFNGSKGEKNRYLFGLLNRTIGLSKKSCGQLPMTQNHIGFVINTVMQKYHYRQEERDARHICNCVRHNINLFITIDYSLIDGFNRKRYLLLDHPEFSSIKLELVTPSEFEGRVLAKAGLNH